MTGHLTGKGWVLSGKIEIHSYSLHFRTDFHHNMATSSGYLRASENTCSGRPSDQQVLGSVWEHRNPLILASLPRSFFCKNI